MAHSDAGVAHLENNVLAGRNGSVASGKRLLEFGVSCPDGETPAVSHSVAGVDGQVQDPARSARDQL